MLDVGPIATLAPTPPPADSLDDLAARAFALDPPMPHERKGILRDEAAFLVDGLLVRVARGSGALSIAIGERLEVLSRGDRVLRIGYSGIGDYAYARLGIARRTAQEMARLARELRDRPVLREAVRTGEVSPRKAEAILPVARGEAEGQWVERARTGTVRALAAAVREERRAAAGRDAPAGAGEERHDDGKEDRWERIWVPLSPEARAKLDQAMSLAGKVLGANPPKWQRLEVICQEFLGAHAPDEPERDGFLREPFEAGLLEAQKAGLEHETACWTFLENLPPVSTPPGPSDEDEPDLLRLDGEVRELAAMRDRWDEVLGHAAMLLQSLGLWKDMCFASFGHYCAERLGMSESAVAQRAWLARRFYTLPSLRTAVRERKVSYEQARLLARCPDDASVGAWIDKAQGMTCVQLSREVEAEDEAQMSARRELALRVPATVADVLGAAIHAARRSSDRWLSLSECVERIAEHFIDTWKGAVPQRMTKSQKVRARDGGLCVVPGCSRASGHSHHLELRSRGGSDDMENQSGMCPPHHLHGVHRGYIRVTGAAPDRLRFELPAPPDEPPFRLPTPWPPPALA